MIAERQLAAMSSARLLANPVCPRKSCQLPTYTLASAVHAELDIRKSRFISAVMPVENRDTALAEVHRLRTVHPDATHVCWALLAGGQSGMSDDGEPSGTAGRPMLEVLRHHDLDGVLATVVRYYGGTKLGAGGLVRAYTDAVATALQHAPRVERIAQKHLAIDADYADEARIRHWIAQQGYVLADSQHGMRVTLTVVLPQDALDAAQQALRDLTHGRAALAPH